ncbi:Predicted membrane protein [Pseudoxanthomonas sp. CF385]|uniref:DUF2069 domain-containing protein n=1 Tax=Pseudoxanthomonas sp. CF385 TaxID=1881042 RepID=UPI00088922E2|nr:DUF2069 domain-containing protein [Pseudoxanthomonas sp. CF385]SDQ44506.1 Predicted membrane protein [Pseudoxanthomonas sp. CF385]
MDRSRLILAGLLQLLAILYAAWFYGDRQYTLALLVFSLPPLLLMIGVMARRRTAAFWASVAALFWFSHAVMVAWADPVKAPFAWVGIVLTVGIVLATSWPAFAKRFGKKA